MVKGFGVAFVFPRVFGSVESVSQLSAGMAKSIWGEGAEGIMGREYTLLPGASWHIALGHTSDCTMPDWPLRQRWRLLRQLSTSSATELTDQPLML